MKEMHAQMQSMMEKMDEMHQMMMGQGGGMDEQMAEPME